MIFSKRNLSISAVFRTRTSEPGKNFTRPLSLSLLLPPSKTEQIVRSLSSLLSCATLWFFVFFSNTGWEGNDGTWSVARNTNAVRNPLPPACLHAVASRSQGTKKANGVLTTTPTDQFRFYKDANFSSSRQFFFFLNRNGAYTRTHFPVTNDTQILLLKGPERQSCERLRAHKIENNWSSW